MTGRGAARVLGSGVAVDSFINDNRMNIDDVTVFEDFFVRRDTVTDDLIGRDAHALGEAAVAATSGNSLLHIDDLFVTNSVQLTGGNTGFDVIANQFQHFSSHTA